MKNRSSSWLEIPCPLTGQVAEIPPGYAARLAGVSRSTASRWLNGRIPEPAKRLLQGLVHGLIPDPLFYRFRARGGALVDLDTGHQYTPVQLQTAYLAHQQVSALRQRLAAIERPQGRVLRLVR